MRAVVIGVAIAAGAVVVALLVWAARIGWYSHQLSREHARDQRERRYGRRVKDRWKER